MMPNDKQHPVEQTVKNGLCMGCGVCVATVSKGQIHLELDPDEGQLVARLNGWIPEDGPDAEVICLGSSLDMKYLAGKVFGRVPEDYYLGDYRAIRVCHSADSGLRRSAASGGVVPVVLKHLFETDSIDMVYCMVPGDGPYTSRGRILRSAAELSTIHGSVYHPFDFGYELRKLIREEQGRFAFVGLPCQIAGLELMKDKIPGLEERHVMSIGLFCGGVNSFQGIAYYLKGFGVQWDDVSNIEYRHGDWPGKIRVQTGTENKEHLIPRIRENSRWKILRYASAFQGYWMLKRCRMCPDQVSDFADIAVGDPHLPKFRKQQTPGFSAVVSRTERGEQLVSGLLDSGTLIEDELSNGQLIRKSQGYCLDNRRHSSVYLKVGRWFGEAVPDITYYEDVAKNESFRHYKWAIFDIAKIKLRHITLLRPLYPFLQAFEYIFVTLYPSLIFKRIFNLLFNRAR